MPIGKTIKCRTCGRVILRYKKPSYTKEEILSAIRRHYKKYHPAKFREFIKKALRTKRKKGIIDKHKVGNPIPLKTYIIKKLNESMDKIDVGDYAYAKDIIKTILEKVS